MRTVTRLFSLAILICTILLGCPATPPRLWPVVGLRKSSPLLDLNNVFNLQPAAETERQTLWICFSRITRQSGCVSSLGRHWGSPTIASLLRILMLTCFVNPLPAAKCGNTRKRIGNAYGHTCDRLIGMRSSTPTLIRTRSSKLSRRYYGKVLTNTSPAGSSGRGLPIPVGGPRHVPQLSNVNGARIKNARRGQRASDETRVGMANGTQQASL